MGIIRGKLESPRELDNRKITVGDPIFREIAPGKWIDIKTGESVEVTITTLEEAFYKPEESK